MHIDLELLLKLACCFGALGWAVWKFWPRAEDYDTRGLTKDEHQP